jgi:acyl-CoA synthetase (NDP forming)
LSPAAQTDIAATLPDLVTVSNPLDYHTFGWRNRAALAATFGAMMRAGADLNLLILDFPRPDRCNTADWDIAAAAMDDAATATGRRAAVLATLPEAMPEAHAEALAARGIVPFFGMDEALQAIAAAADAGAAHGTASVWQCTEAGAPETLSEWDGKRLLSAFGVEVPAGRLAANAAAAREAAAALGFPVVVKATGAALAHKTEHGAVMLNLRDADSVEEAAAALLPLTGLVLVERMVEGVVAELLIGVARDPVLGLYIMIGAGGVLAELLSDTATMLLPASRAELAHALHGLRVAKLLNGFRGNAPGDIPAAIDAILAVQDFAMAHAGRLQELDVNPLMVRQAGMGAVAADVLMRLAPEPDNA